MNWRNLGLLMVKCSKNIFLSKSNNALQHPRIAKVYCQHQGGWSSEILRGERSQILCCSRNTNSRCNNKMSLKEARGEVNEHIDQHEDTATTQRRGGRLPLRASGWILLLDQLRVQVKKMTKLCQVDSSLKMSPLLVTSALPPATSPPGKRRACLPGKSSTSPSSLP